MFTRNGALIGKKFTQYLLSTILMSMALSLGTIVDGILASNFLGTEALAAINTCQPVILVFGAVYSIFGAGGSTLAATAMGRGEKEKADYYFTMAMGLLLVFGLLVIAIVIPSMDLLVDLVTAGSSLGEMARDYLSVLVFGAVVLFLVPGFSFFIRTDGNPTLAALILVAANVVNLGCDALYMGLLGLGVKGAALATVSGYVVGLLMAVTYLMSKKRTLHFKIKGIEGKFFLDILVCGLPNALNSVLMTIKMLALNKTAIAILGDDGASAVAICNNCLSFASIFIGGAAQTMLPIIAVLYGENDKNGMIAAFKKALQIVLIAGLVMVVVFEVFPSAVVSVFNVQTPELFEIAMLAVRLFGFSLPLFALVYVYMSYYQATGKRLFAVTITCCEGLVFIVPMILLLGRWLPNRGMGIWLSFVCSEVMTLFLILAVSFTIAKRTHKQSILLFEPDNDASFDVTVRTSVQNAVQASREVMQFCQDNGVDTKRTNTCGIAIEEMLVNTVLYGYQNKPDENIDLVVRLQEGQLIIRIRDNGIPFDPLEYQPKGDGIEYRATGIHLLKSMARSVEYSRALGFNNLIIKI